MNYTQHDLIGTNKPVALDLCEAVIDPGDHFGATTGFPEPPELCDNDVVPGHSYCELHLDEYATDLTPDQVHAIGLEEVARIRARMDEEMRAAGWTGDFAGFLAFLRSDPQFYAASREDLLAEAGLDAAGIRRAVLARWPDLSARPAMGDQAATG